MLNPSSLVAAPAARARPPLSAVYGLLRATGGHLSRPYRAWREGARRHHLLAANLGLSDHLLRDIGLTRADIMDAHFGGSKSKEPRS